MALLSARLVKSINPPLFGNLIKSLTSLHLVSESHQKAQVNANLPSQKVKPLKCDTEFKHIFQDVNKHLSSENKGRLFAVVQLCGKQFKITSGDIIVVEGYWPPTNSDRIRLEKVLLVAGNNFTLLGRPILETELVDVQATIVEKTLSHTKTHFKKKRRKQYERINFQRSPLTMIRINSIDVLGKLNSSSTDLNPVKMF